MWNKNDPRLQVKADSVIAVTNGSFATQALVDALGSIELGSSMDYIGYLEAQQPWPKNWYWTALPAAGEGA